jgi:hypothetical protein
MPAAPRHAKHKASAVRRGAPIAAAATLAGVAAAFVSLHGGSAAPGSSDFAAPVTSAGSGGSTSDRVATAVHREVATLEARIVRQARRAARSRHLAAQRAQQQAPPSTAQPTPAPPLSSGGGDAANSPLGVCIRDAEEGGSYAWGPGNGGGAYQFLLGTWEKYGGAASEYGVAGPAYQNQIFDNAIAAGGASNWTDYDGC